MIWRAPTAGIRRCNGLAARSCGLTVPKLPAKAGFAGEIRKRLDRQLARYVPLGGSEM